MPRYTWPTKSSRTLSERKFIEAMFTASPSPTHRIPKCWKEAIPISFSRVMKFLICADLFFSACGKLARPSDGIPHACGDGKRAARCAAAGEATVLTLGWFGFLIASLQEKPE